MAWLAPPLSTSRHRPSPDAEDSPRVNRFKENSLYHTAQTFQMFHRMTIWYDGAHSGTPARCRYDVFPTVLIACSGSNEQPHLYACDMQYSSLHETDRIRTPAILGTGTAPYEAERKEKYESVRTIDAWF